MINNRKASSGLNPPSNPDRPKETLFLNSPFSILHSLRFVLLCLFLPAISLCIGQVPGTPYGVQSLDCSSAPATPGTITLSTDYVIAGTAFIASISEVTGAKSYEWVLADGLSGSSTGSSITVTAVSTGTFASTAITVKAVNDCGSSNAASLPAGFECHEPGKSAIYTGLAPCTGGSTAVYYYSATDAQREAFRRDCQASHEWAFSPTAGSCYVSKWVNADDGCVWYYYENCRRATAACFK
jgi:hypothetical protein